MDRLVDLAHAETRLREMSLRRWYGFVSMQNAVARKCPASSPFLRRSGGTTSWNKWGGPGSVAKVPVGADHELFRPPAGRPRVPGRVMTTASADVPIKGLAYLLEALAKLRTEKPDAHLVVVGEPRPASAAAQVMDRLGLESSAV